ASPRRARGEAYHPQSAAKGFLRDDRPRARFPRFCVNGRRGDRGVRQVNPGDLALSGISVLLSAQSAYATALMLYAWEDAQKRDRSLAPRTFEPPRTRFTILLPARHEEAVIQDTVQRVVDLNYPRELVQVLVVIEAGDHGTIAKVEERLA